MDEMLAADFDEYHLASFELEAQETIKRSIACDMPHMKPKDRSSTISKLKEIAYPVSKERRREMTLGQLAAKLSGIGGKSGSK